MTARGVLLLLFFPWALVLAQGQATWPCADEVAKTGPYSRVLNVGTPISNDGLVERRVLPDISDIKGKRLTSSVAVDVILDLDGKVACAHAKGNADPLATRSVEAAKQWKFKPYLLNDKPIPIQTQIVFVFKRDAGGTTVASRN